MAAWTSHCDEIDRPSDLISPGVVHGVQGPTLIVPSLAGHYDSAVGKHAVNGRRVGGVRKTDPVD